VSAVARAKAEGRIAAVERDDPIAKRADMRAKLALEDGTVLEGTAFGHPGERSGEVVFNTAMTGYQEILTDPSYKGQIVTMTCPLIGNYGVNAEDDEHERMWAEGFVVREMSRIRSNFRSTEDLDACLRRNRVVGISGIDTRMVTKRLRERGALRGVISAEDLDDASLVRKARAVPPMEGLDLVPGVTCRTTQRWTEVLRGDALAASAPPSRFRVACLDFGMKRNILRCLVRVGCDATVFPAQTPAREILDFKPDGVFLSNGPGDPAAVTYAIEAVRGLLGKAPIFGICLGHQILSLACGGRTYKLKFGHHGANHPVMDLATRRIAITSQNHGFAADPASLGGAGVEVTHRNLNDQTVEGLRHTSLPAFSVQYHPEAAPGPHDAQPLFERFTQMMAETRGRN
jgi:carbamoyl-phosphate synthase small subunit